MFKTTAQGNWLGTNKLWFDKPEAALSDGSIQVSESALRYTWHFEGTKHTGAIALFGPVTSLRATWSDSWHQSDETTMHGFEEHGLFKLFGTYLDGEGGEWGWRITLDTRDPDVFQLRMYNVEPNGTIHIAVDLRGAKQ